MMITLKINGIDYPAKFGLVNEAVANVEVFKASIGESIAADGTCTPEYPLIGASCGLDTTSDLTHAQRILSGSVKWDGCSDIQFFPDDDGYEHFCGMKGAMALGDIMKAVYGQVREMIDVQDVEMYEGR